MGNYPTRWKYLFRTNVCRFLMVPIWVDGDKSKDPEYVEFGNAGSGVNKDDPRRGYGYYGTNDPAVANALVEQAKWEYTRTNKKSFYPVKKQTKQTQVEVEMDESEMEKPGEPEKTELIEVCDVCGKEYTGKTAVANLKTHKKLKHN